MGSCRFCSAFIPENFWGFCRNSPANGRGSPACGARERGFEPLHACDENRTEKLLSALWSYGVFAGSEALARAGKGNQTCRRRRVRRAGLLLLPGDYSCPFEQSSRGGVTASARTCAWREGRSAFVQCSWGNVCATGNGRSRTSLV